MHMVYLVDILTLKMFERRNCLLALLLAAVYAAAVGLTIDVSEEAAQRLMLEVNHVFWHNATAYRKSNDDTLSPQTLLREQLRGYYERMQQFDWQQFRDPLLRRQFEIILRGAKYAPLDLKYRQTLLTFKNVGRKRWACDRQNSTKCNLAYIPHIKSIITNSNDFEELKYYWAEWRNKMPADVAAALKYYVQYYQDMSTAELKPSAIWYEEYDDANYIKELEQIICAIQPMYQQLHAHIREVLRITYGKDVVNSTGLIPHHLMEQMTYQAWKKNSVLKNPYQHRRLPNLQSDIIGIGYNPNDLIDMSQKYFGFLGFPNLTKDFMEKHFIQMDQGGPDCKSRISDFGELEVEFCPKVHFRKLLQTHDDIAQVRYAISKNNFSVGLNQDACPGFANAIGEAIILSVSNPTHLQKCLGFLSDYNYDDYLNLNRLFRLAVHTLLTLPTYFVHEKLWVDMIDGNIKPDQYNKHYWQLMEKYLGVGPPVSTNGAAYDMPYKFYEGIIPQYRSTKKLFGEFLGYQIYRDICLKIGEYERDNSYKLLQFCDFDQKANSGTYLREMMNAGSTKTWRELIKPLNGKLSGVSASAFLEYYDPVVNWLTDENANNNVHIGW